jgi:hypothetical protein
MSMAGKPHKSKRPRNAWHPGPLEAEVRYELVVVPVVPDIVIPVVPRVIIPVVPGVIIIVAVITIVGPAVRVAVASAHEKMVTAVVGGAINDRAPDIDREPVSHVVVVVRLEIDSPGIVGLVIDAVRVIDVVRNPAEDLLVPPLHMPVDPFMRIVMGRGLGWSKREDRGKDPEDGKSSAKQFHGVTSCAGAA